jgi:AcrR family transcriptional regulator
MRSDAASNRERVLAAAAEAIAAHGEKVPMAEIAEQAGVGVGTLYRHFPTRERLFAGLTLRSLQGVLARARRAAREHMSAIDALEWFLEETIAQRDTLILPLHGAPLIPDKEILELRREIRRELERVLARGRRDGDVRADVTAEDIIIAGATLAQPLANVADWDTHARRQARVLIAGLGVTGGRPLPGTPRRPTGL